MYSFCVFAGTTEGRELVSFLTSQSVSVTACVATEYGETLLEPASDLTISACRLDKTEMVEMFASNRFDMVIDATHPYAHIVTENIAQACSETDTPYLRLLREGGGAVEDAIYVDSIASAAAYLNRTSGNILVTTGSKELSAYTALTDFASRVYARVLPMEASLQICHEVGLAPAHIFALQGPFSKEMNIAMLRSISAAYMVTKEAGHAGGFDEKIAAAKETGAIPIVIGRPPQREGRSYEATIRFLCQEYGFTRKPQVTIVGIGPGNRNAMTQEVAAAILEADCIIGAKRMLAATARPHQPTFDAIAPKAISDYIHETVQYDRFAVVMSGDVGFYSGTKKLLPMLTGCDVKILPGLSSLSYLCARLGTSYEDIHTFSLHGRDDDIIPELRMHDRVFVLVGGENGVSDLCRKLTDCGCGTCRVSVGERLSYPDETITVGTACELAQKSFQSLSAVLIEQEPKPHIVTHGIPDDRFRRGEGADGVVPMTKNEVRSVALSKLQLTTDAVCWDIGAGTGSVAIEMALQVPRGQVYAIECKEAALSLLQENCSKFGTANVTVVPGFAPAVCEDLPAPTHAFIGGSSGNMKEILTLLIKKNPSVRIVATAITLESVAELTDCMKMFDFTETEVVSLSVAKSRKAGRYHLMMGQNPIYIFTMQTGGKPV